jgi:hypothetical protein
MEGERRLDKSGSDKLMGVRVDDAKPPATPELSEHCLHGHSSAFWGGVLGGGGGRHGCEI